MRNKFIIITFIAVFHVSWAIFQQGEVTSSQALKIELENIQSKAKGMQPTKDYDSNIQMPQAGQPIYKEIFNNLFLKLNNNMSYRNINTNTYNIGDIVDAIDIQSKLADINSKLNSNINNIPDNQGSVIVSSGETLNLTPGSVNRYESLVVEAGGNIVINDGDLSLTEIVVRGDFVLNGTISGRGFFPGGNYSANSITTGTNFNFSIPQSSGGNGGSGWTGYSPGYTAYGNGGGGARSDAPCVAGSGANGNSASMNVPGGAIGTYWGCGCGCYGGGGGAGGIRGKHGHSLLIIVEGDFEGNGVINLSGENGAAGSAGETAGNGGGGGGGGAGGSGGKLFIRYAGALSPGIQKFIDGGSGGSGGSGGGATVHNVGYSGSEGSPGVSGSISEIQINFN